MELHPFEPPKAGLATTAWAAQLLQLEATVQLAISHHPTEVALARRTNATIAARTCPRCTGHDVVLHGKDQNRRQRFMCRGCNRTYNIMTGTPMAHARKPEKWSRYLGCMTNHMPIRKIVAAGIGLNHVTVFRWRHRFLVAAANDTAAILSGVIEADETDFPLSFKGDRGWKSGNPPTNRKAHRRGWGGARRDRSAEQVPVLSALDTGGGIYQAILSSLDGIEALLEGRIAAGSVLCSDGAAGYEAVADQAGAEHCIIPAAANTLPADRADLARPQWQGRLGLRRVNAHHQQLRLLVDWRCRGVATKYLGHYLGWHRAMCRAGFVGTALLDRALA